MPASDPTHYTNRRTRGISLGSNSILMAVIMLTVLLSACATLQPVSIDSDGLPSQAHISDLTYFPQPQYYCGPASLATLLKQRGIDTDPERLAPRVYLPGKRGSLQVELIAQTRQHQLLAYLLQPTLKAVLMEINAGNPVLVMQNLGFSWWPQWHYAVATGYDLKHNTLELSSGNQHHYTMPLALFAKTWRRAGNWALIALPPTRLPASADALTYLSAVNDLEQVGLLETAQAGYQTALQHWPDNAGALLGLGNTSLALEQPDQAQIYFRKLIRQFPHLPAGWNNLAYALQKSGCPHEALSAAECAVTVAVDEKTYRETLAEMQAITNSVENPHRCKPITCMKSGINE